MNKATKFLNGIIYSSQEMANYFSDRVLGRNAPPSVVIPPCWPAQFQSHARPQSIGENPNLIFTGRTDLSGRTVQASDDIRPLMREILEANIELHHAFSPETNDRHPRRKYFSPLALPRLIEMMGGFDASLIAYNTDVCSRDDRFWLTVPDRLITSVASGIPIAIHARGYSAAKSYLKDYPAMIQFDSPRDLARTLAERTRVSELRDAAWIARKNYVAEAHGGRLRRFLELL